MGGPGLRKAQDVTDASTKGLLPQLTDVLHALTDSHALLLSKIQSVRLKHISVMYPEMELLRETSDVELDTYVDVRKRSRVDTGTWPMSEMRGPLLINEVDSNRTASGFESSPGFVVAAAEPPDQIATSPSPASAGIVNSSGDSIAGFSSQTPLFSDGDDAQPGDSTGNEWENRSYNFFDELDARLAGLGNAESAEASE